MKLYDLPPVVTWSVSAPFLDQKLLPELSGAVGVAVRYRMAGWILNEAGLPPEVLVIETVMSAPVRLETQGMTRDSQASGPRIQH